MKFYRLIIGLVACAFWLTTSAQSFDSLRRSTGKSALYAAVEKALNGTGSVDEAISAIASGDLKAPYDGRTPVYLVLDFLAKHPKKECATAERLLDAFLARKDFDVDLRYSTLLPPLSHLIRTNYEALGGKFSSDYISESVVQKLIEAGATVNTYYLDGSTLMKFATATNNRYLQNYFVDSGIDLRHEDKSGHDDAYKLIADGNLTTLKRAVDAGTLTLTIENLKNDTKDFAKYSQLYDFVANQCAKHAEEYSSLNSFRTRFNDRKALVQAKWEKQAREQSAQAKTFDDIMNVESLYPDVPTITDPVKLSIYRRDSQRMLKVYESAKAFAAGTSSSITDKSWPAAYVETYLDKYHYDPDNRIQIASETADFINVTEALRINPNTDYIIEYSFLGLVELDIDIDVNTIKHHAEVMNKATNTVNSQSSTPVFNSYYAKVKDELSALYQKVRANVERNYNEYKARKEAIENQKRADREAAFARSQQRAREREAEREAEKAREKAEREAEEAREAALDESIENMDMPEYSFETDWEKENLFFPNEKAQNKMAENQVRRIKFPGVGSCKIYRVIGSKGFWASTSKRYETLDDAIKASYANLKYGKIRQNGRMYGILY